MHRLLSILVTLLLCGSLLCSALFAEGGGAPAPADATGTPAAGQQQGTKPAEANSMLPMFLIMGAFGLFVWFKIIKPERKAQADQKALVESLKPGDEVVTMSGMQGRVISRDGDTVNVEVGEGKVKVEIRFSKSAVTNRVVAPVIGAAAEKKA